MSLAKDSRQRWVRGNETKPKINMLTHLTLGTKLRLLVEIDDKEGKRQLNNEKKYSYI